MAVSPAEEHFQTLYVLGLFTLRERWPRVMKVEMCPKWSCFS